MKGTQDVYAPGADVDEELAAIATRLRRSTVQVYARGGHGSGLIASEDGAIVTNAHVARGRKAHIRFDDGSDARGEVAASAPERDLALIRIDARGLPAPAFRDARTLRPGELVIAAGNPLDLIGAVTAGIVHSADPRGRRVVADLTLLPGNSGGPLADAAGRIVGVNSMVIDRLAVAIGSPAVQRFVAAPYARPHVGVVASPVEVPVMGQRRSAALIIEVSERSAASRAGIMPGDAVIGVDGRLFSDFSDLALEIETAEIGRALRLDVVRGGRVQGIDVVVGDAGRRAKAA